jgi:PPM family protein phosphatase
MLQKHLARWLTQNSSARAVRGVTEAGAILASDRGLKREENEDRIAAMRYCGERAEFLCFVVADGMGGLRDGAECAEITIAALFDALIATATRPPWDRLEEAVRFANSQVYLSKRGSGGSTLSAILVEGEHEIYSANVGDSRIYVEPSSAGGELNRVTIDDSLEEAFGGQGRELLQFIGVGKGLQPHINRLESAARSIAITTDGIHFLDNNLLKSIYLNAPDRRSAADRLLALSRWFGGPDNATIAIISPTNIKGCAEGSENSRYAEFWGLQDTLRILLSPAAPEVVLADTNNPKRVASKRQRSRRQKSASHVATEKAEQLKIDIEIEEKTPDGSDS